MPKHTENKAVLKPWQCKLHEVIFEADTPAGKLFDVLLLVAIILSVLVVMLESVPTYDLKYHDIFFAGEWVFTILFTIEYFMRIVSIQKPWKYIFSFYGLVDLLSIIPTYLGLFVSGTNSLMVIRSLRLMRVFRILKLEKYVIEAGMLGKALRQSRNKIIVFLFALLAVVIILGTTMYLVESAEAGFTSIPRSIYWAIITLTTVGYGDIAPVTPLGQFIASIVMILGYAVIAVPTGIVTTELIKGGKKTNTQACPSCSKEGHDDDADFCKYCGASLNPNE
ncbi:MAG: ion transporter [Crocinitomicaceae bacterium]|nr:ion transporter [Crocinitomicaceae bacterium]